MDRKLLVVAWGIVLAWGIAPLGAQEGALTAMYGKGVHLYFSGQVFQADASFTAAIEGGSVDPRVYFFRGLNYLRLHREPEAMADFARGAALEAAAPGPPFDVSRALTRIQGGPRLLIERIRQKARLEAAVAAQAQQRDRYDELRPTEPDVLLAPPATAPEPVQPPAAGTAPVIDPFAEPATMPPAAPPAPAESPPVEAPPSAPMQGKAPAPASDPFAPPDPNKIADPPVERP
jgi:hypothetical protein